MRDISFSMAFLIIYIASFAIKLGSSSLIKRHTFNLRSHRIEDFRGITTLAETRHCRSMLIHTLLGKLLLNHAGAVLRESPFAEARARANSSRAIE